MFKKLVIGLSVIVLVTLSVFAVSKVFAEGPVKINIGTAGPPFSNMDPTVWGGGYAAAQRFNVVEPLITQDVKKKVVGLLAESWSWSPDGKVLTVKLRKNVKFSTGEKLTAKDVVFSIERTGFGKNKNLAIADQLNPMAYDHAEAVDDLTVKFIFPKTNVQFISQTLYGLNIVSKEQFDKLGEEQWAKNPSGTGPYKVTEWKSGQYADLAINENYRGKKPQITEAHFALAMDNATRINMLKAGEVDLIDQTDWKAVAELEKAGFKRWDMEQPHDVALQFHLFNPDTPWANIKVRQAINYAIDKESLIKKLFAGIPKPGSWLLPWELGYDPSLKPSYPFNLAKAKQLMKEAGYPDGFEMPLIYLSDMSWAKDMVDYLSNALMQIKITTKVTAIAGFPNFMDAMRNMHDKKDARGVVLFDFGWPGNPEAVINLTNGYWSGKPNSLYSRPDLDAIIEKALVTLDNNKRAQLIKQAYKIADGDLPFIPMFLEVSVFMMKGNIKYTPSQGGMENGPAGVFDLTIK